MTGTRGKRVKLSPTTHSPSIPIDPALTGMDHGSPSFDSPNASPQPQASGSNGGGGGGGNGGNLQSTGTDRAAERKERNRLAAQRSRDKRAAEFQAVAEQLSMLRIENEELKIKLEEKDDEIRQKDLRILELESIVANSTSRNGNGNSSSTTTTTTTGTNSTLGGGLSDLVHASNFLDQF